ncbi:hypothetical protein RCK77_25035, partial [Salmonella enterica subsp. enterica serovar 1,4,[5],12:i:-]
GMIRQKSIHIMGRAFKTQRVIMPRVPLAKGFNQSKIFRLSVLAKPTIPFAKGIIRLGKKRFVLS